MWLPPPDPAPDWLRGAEHDADTFFATQGIPLRGLAPDPEPPMTAPAPAILPRATIGPSSLAAALVAARAEIAAIPKSSTNPFFKSKYASLDAIIEAVMPILNRHGLTITQGTTAPDRDEHGIVSAFTVVTTLLHTSGETLAQHVVMPLAWQTIKGPDGAVSYVLRSDPQGAGGALTYGRRYGLSALLCLATEDDDDGNSASQGAKPRAAKAAKPAPPKSAELVLMPIGKEYKDKPLGEIPTDKLAGALKWCQETAPIKFASLIGSIETVLEDRRIAADVARGEREMQQIIRDATQD